MARATWRVLAFGALFSAMALPASAQVVIGGNGQPNVEVNWSVLDSLGRQPTLADMLKAEVPVSNARAALNQGPAKGVQFHSYKAGPATKAKAAKKVAQPKAKKPSVIQASAKAPAVAAPVPAVAQLVQAAQKAEPVRAAEPPVAIAKAEGPKAELPKVELPKAEPVKAEPVKAEAAKSETPKSDAARAEATKPMEVPKVAPQPSLPAKTAIAPMAEPTNAVLPSSAAQPVGPQGLTPPPPAAQVASLAPVPAPAAGGGAFKGDTLSVVFGADSARLPDAIHGDLDKLVKRMQKDDGVGLQLLAYAEGDDANASKARRLSLSRALEVRKYLMEQGVRSTRIEVRALGNKLEGAGPADRVDAVLVSR